MAGARSHVSGLKEIEAAFQALGNRGAMRRTADRALRRAAEPIRDEWAANVDVDKGDLQRSIKIGKAISGFQKRGNSGDTVSTFVGIDESEDPRLHIYAPIEEFGDENQPANPAGRAAFESRKQEALDRLKGDLWGEISKTAARQARKRAKVANT